MEPMVRTSQLCGQGPVLLMYFNQLLSMYLKLLVAYASQFLFTLNLKNITVTQQLNCYYLLVCM